MQEVLTQHVSLNLASRVASRIGPSPSSPWKDWKPLNQSASFCPSTLKGQQRAANLRSSARLRKQYKKALHFVSCELDPGGNGNAFPQETPRRDSREWSSAEPSQNWTSFEREPSTEPRRRMADNEPQVREEGKEQRANVGDEAELPNRIFDGQKVYLDELDVVALLDPSSTLQPLNPLSYNAAAYLWKKIGDIPPERRARLLDILRPEHISRLWQVAGTRYFDEDLFTGDANDMLPDVRANDPLAAEVWDGRVIGLPLPLGWLGRFQKAFFVGTDDGVYGRVLSGGPLLGGVADLVAPLYFRVQPAGTVQATGQRCDATFVYQEGQLQLRDSGVPPGFPTPRGHVWPFSDGMRDYVRPAGPGVLVGQSWQDGPDPQSTSKQFLGEFILVRKNL